MMLHRGILLFFFFVWKLSVCHPNLWFSRPASLCESLLTASDCKHMACLTVIAHMHLHSLTLIDRWCVGVCRQTFTCCLSLCQFSGRSCSTLKSEVFSVIKSYPWISDSSAACSRCSLVSPGNTGISLFGPLKFHPQCHTMCGGS